MAKNCLNCLIRYFLLAQAKVSGPRRVIWIQVINVNEIILLPKPVTISNSQNLCLSPAGTPNYEVNGQSSFLVEQKQKASVSGAGRM